MEVSWTQPTTNNFAIDQYLILIEAKDGSYVEETTYCAGSSSQIVTDAKCLIPMSTLRASPYNLVLGDSVNAKVKAHNSRGWSAYSLVGTGATVQTEPLAMVTVSRGTATSNQ